MSRTLRNLPVLLLAWSAVSLPVEFQVPLPTPREHYKTYNIQQASLELLARISANLDPESRKILQNFLMSGADASKLAPIPPERARKLAEAMGLRKYKTDVLELFLHQSQVLDMIPEKYRGELLPIVHDALLAFMDGLDEDRLAERVVAMARAPKDAARGERILILASRIPTLQKLGQVLARFDGIPPDIQSSLQTLENQISTMSRDEIVAFITHDIGDETIREHQIEFEDRVLAEASIGAVIRASFVLDGEARRQEAVCKMIKPYALKGLPEEMAIIDGLIELADKHSDFYRIGDLPLKDLFEDIKAKLGDELRVTQEQANFKRAYEYYRGRRGVKVPEVYSFSTANVTFMQYLNGEKITDAFRGDPQKRAILARRLADIMTFETLFSKRDTSIFHGDPHAGNVMHVTNDPADPYTIGLLDWGLLGEFPREQRLEMAQLSLALEHKSKKRLFNNVGALIRGGMPRDPRKQEEIKQLAGECLSAKGTMAEVYGKLIEELMMRGYALDPNLSLFIKSQLTLAGIFRELDPNLNPDKYLRGRVGKLVMKELPKRLFLLPAWNYRGYRSLLSNGDVFADLLH